MILKHYIFYSIIFSHSTKKVLPPHNCAIIKHLSVNNSNNCTMDAPPAIYGTLQSLGHTL